MHNRIERAKEIRTDLGHLLYNGQSVSRRLQLRELEPYLLLRPFTAHDGGVSPEEINRRV